MTNGTLQRADKFYCEYYATEHANFPRSDWGIRMAAEFAIQEIEQFKEHLQEVGEKSEEENPNRWSRSGK